MALALDRSHYALPTGYLSPSQINEYRDCPRCYCLNRVERKPKPDTIHFAIGGGIHKAAETIGRHIIAGRDWNLDEALTAAEQDFHKRLENPIDEDGNQIDVVVDFGKYDDGEADDAVVIGKAKDDTIRFTRLLCERLPRLFKERGLVAVELQMVSDQTLVNPGEEGLLVDGFWPFPFKARLDHLYGDQDGFNAVTDLKTASKRGGPDENGKLQFVTYGLPAYQTGTPWRVGTDILLKQRTADMEHRWANTDGYLTEANIDWGYNVVLDVAERISRGDFPIGKGWNGRHAYDHGEPVFELAVSGFSDG